MRSLREITQEIRADWKNVNHTAEPYLQAMEQLDDINDDFYFDSGKSMVLYFLAKAQTWRGETARRIKKELNQMAEEAK
jgi:hypothetical protein